VNRARQPLAGAGVIEAGDSDERLVERCLARDAQAFTALVLRYQRPVYNAAFRVLGSADDASDVTQAVFLKVFERLEDFDPEYRFFSWIYRIAMNESLNLLRRNGRDEPLGEDDEYEGPESAGPEWKASEAEASERIQGTLMRMKAADRAVITLRHFADCSYEEIARILDIDEKTVKSRLFEARNRMRELLADLRPART
jgi:RNA polymerase sigma-70 factor (ECF subfamily)